MKRIAAVLAMLFLLTSCATNAEPPVSPDVPEPPTTVEAPELPSAPPEITPPAGIKWELADLWGRIDGSTATIPLTAALYDFLNGGGDWPPVHNTTSAAYGSLIYGSADLIFVTYPSENEFNMARDMGIELEIIPVTKDALVFLVNTENAAENVSSSGLRDIYTGTTTNWNAVGGADEAIIPYQRTADSGSQTLFLKLVMDGAETMKPPTEWVQETMGSLVESVSYYDNAKNAVGYSMFYYVNNMYGNSQFKLLSVDGVKPTRDTITRGEYPLEDNYYAVMRKDTPADSPARKLVDWLLTDDGQALAVKAGYIPLRPIEGAEPEDAIDPVYLGNTENSSGTGGTMPKTGDEITDAVNDNVRKPLSDMFFDGFNYVAYINGEIMARLDSIDNEFFNSTRGEQMLIRPFTGIPNDYPHYRLTENGYLNISFPDGNPFFAHGRSFDVVLTADISPYGRDAALYSVSYDYSRRMLPNVNLFTLSVDLPQSPEIAARINEQLRAWETGFESDADSMDQISEFIKWYGNMLENPDIVYSLQPSTGLWRDYLSVYYVLQTYDGPAGFAPLMYLICFDITTGETVNLAEKLPRDIDFSQAFVYGVTRFKDGEYVSGEGVPEGYVMPEGSVITKAWGDDWLFYMYITEPDGREVMARFWEWSE